jgi:putative CocE/NonD family hydrolase
MPSVTPTRILSLGRRAFALFTALSLAACGAIPAALSGNDDDDDDATSADGVGSELGSAGEPDYTAEELAALAETPLVQQNLFPFGNAPAPDRALHVTMSDGVRIAVSLYFPPGFDPEQDRAPVAYSETWYRRWMEALGMSVDLYREAGFVVAIADPRGFGASFGAQSSFLSEAQRNDQREMMQWLAAQPWASGEVAAVGISVSGMLAEAMLASGAPSLKAGVVRATELDQYSQNLFPGGIRNERIHGLISEVLGLMRAEPCLADAGACADFELGPVDGDSDLSLLRAALADHQANIAPNALAGTIYSDDRAGTATFNDVSPKARLATMSRYAVPTRLAASWLDGATAAGALEQYNALPGVMMQVSIGATTHLGGLDADPFSREAFAPAASPPSEWFGEDIAFLKSVLAGEKLERSVRYYVLGAGVWKRTKHWPPSDVQDETLYLTSTRLQRAGWGKRGERSYRVDPTTSSGAHMNRWASGTNEPLYFGDRRFTPGDKLSFDAAPVRSDSELVGAPELCLALRSDQPDGIVIAYLEDVAPDGRSTYLTEGELRLLHRKTASGSCNAARGTERSFERAAAAPVVPGERMQIELPLLPVAARIAKGHHLRLTLVGADEGTFAPLSDVPANWSVAYGGKDGSRLTVPLKPWRP